MFRNRRGGDGSTTTLVGPAVFVAFCLSIVGSWSVIQGRPSRDSEFERLTSAKSDSVERLQAAADIANRGEAAVPQLVEALSHSDVRVRSSAAYSLSQIGKGQFQIPPEILSLLHDRELILRRYALRTYSNQCRDSDAVLAVAFPILLDERCVFDDTVSSVIESCGRAALPRLYELANHREARIRCYAVKLLSRIDGVADENLSAIRRLQNDRHHEVRLAALVALHELQSLNNFDLMNALGDENADLVLYALQNTVPEFLPADGKLVDRLEQLLQSPNLEIQLMVALTLSEAGPEARNSIPALSEKIKSINGMGRVVIADVLASLAAAPETFAAVLTDVVFETECVDSAWWSAFLLAKYAPGVVETILPRIEANIESSDLRVSATALVVIAGFGPAAAKSVPTLTRVLSSHDVQRHLLAAIALRRMGPAARSAVPVLIDLLHQLIREYHLTFPGDGDTDESSAESFGFRLPASICAMIHSLRPGTIQCWDKGLVECPLAAVIEMLGILGHRDAEALEAVLQAADYPSREARMAVATAIADLDCDLTRSMVALRRLCKDTDSFVCGSARRAIQRIQSGSRYQGRSAAQVTLHRAIQ